VSGGSFGGGAGPRTGRLVPVAATVAAAGLGVLSVVTTWVSVHRDRGPLLVVEGVAAVLVVSGGAAWFERRRVPIARQVLLLGALLFVPPLRASTVAAVFAPAFCLSFAWTVPPAVLALGWPEGRLRSGADRALVALAALGAVGSQTLLFADERPEPGWLAHGGHGRSFWADVGSGWAMVLTLVIGVRVVRRLRRRPAGASPLTRSSDVVSASVLIVSTAVVVATTANLAGVSDAQIQVLVPLVALLSVPQAVWMYRRLERQMADDATAAAGERRRIRDDLHDETQGLLVAAQLAIEQARRAPGDRRDELLDSAHQRVADAVQTIRDVTRAIYPPALQERGLAAALETLAARAPVPVDLHVPHQRWRRRVEYNAYFAVSELVTNALKHAAPSRIDVRVVDDDGLHITVQDDGNGGVRGPDDGGLRQLRERLTTVDGRIVAVTSTPGAGTSLRIYIPEA
jgi:signal transduction histidine kinase